MSSADLDPFEDLRVASQPAPSAELAQRIKRQCTQNLVAKRATSATQRVCISACAAGAGLVAILLMKSDLATLGQPMMVGALYASLGWALVLASVLAIGLLRPPGKRATFRQRLLLVSLVPASFFAYLALNASEVVPVTAALLDAHTIGCGASTLVSSACVALLVMLPWRHTDPFTPGLTGALLGLVGGLAAGIAVGIVCPSREAWHLWLSHGLSLLAIVIVTAWLGRRWLAP